MAPEAGCAPAENGGNVPHLPHLLSQIPGPDYVPVQVTDIEEELYSDAEPHVSLDELAWLRPLPWWRRPRPLLLLPVILLFSLALGVILAPRMELFLSIICQDLGVDTSAAPGEPPHVPSNVCRRSVEAQRHLSMLQMKLLVIAGLASAFMTGYWSRLSDRVGRKRLLFSALAGAIVNDAMAVLLSFVPADRVPFGADLFVLGSGIEGFFGSSGTVTAMSQSYLSDVTPSGTRSRLFALMSGILFAGIAIGPAIGGLLTKWTASLSVPLCVAIAIHGVIAVCLPLVPESLPPDARRKAIQSHEAARRRHAGHSMLYSVFQALVAPLQNLGFLLPRRPNAEEAPVIGSGFDTPSHRWDANLLLLSVAYAVELSCIAIVPIKIQYVQLVFGWSSSTVGYFVSFTALCRMLSLTVFVPLMTKILHRMPSTTVLPQDGAYTQGDDVHAALDEQGYARDEPRPKGPWTRQERMREQQWKDREKALRLIHDSHMDMRVAVGSSLITCVGSVVSAHAHSTGLFLLGVFLVALGGGVGSAISSLGMAVLPQNHGAGRLFGAWGVLSTLSGSIMGPILFSVVFSRSVSSAPWLVFYIVALLQFVVIASLSMVRLASVEALTGLPPRPRRPERRRRT
ncbi:hypothetical protein MNAN1_000748 [Malassezia nana]|uniref:Major facilitator superfamily (MFS) profile domain-containing protein n=1 Tax=Malassezia nana TaxID=180528 RepID=A0AAF0EG38_9BASI|nr:hypothetical protein MNAN1_000748 [Malassezia nana]